MRSLVLRLDSNDGLIVRTFSIAEALSASFQVHVVADGPDDLDIHQTGKPASFLIVTDKWTRLWTGVSASISLDHVDQGGRATYEILLAPELCLLCHRTNYRLFQHQSIPDIATKLLAEWNIQPDMRLKEQYAKLELRVQYGETDYDFLRRLLAEAGISFYFESTKDGSKLVLSDEPNMNPARSEPLPYIDAPELGSSVDHVTGVTVRSKLHSTKATFADHDFMRPHYRLAGHHEVRDVAGGGTLEHYQFQYGHSQALQKGGSNGHTPVADANGAYRRQDQTAKAAATRWIEGLRGVARTVAFETSVLDLVPGSVFSVEGYPHPEVAGKKLLVKESWIHGGGVGQLISGGQCVPADASYRPHLSETFAEPKSCAEVDVYKPLTAILRPRIMGVQTALVVGPSGQDVHTDEHGRVRVQFPWDRETHGPGDSSAWIRVSQASAGVGQGQVELPRVGQEVLVSYLDGDPDQPTVVGRVHNTTTPVAYSLPGNKARSTWKNGSPTGNGNEVTFDDQPGQQLFYMQAERDLHKVVKHDELEHTVGDRHISVDGDFILQAARIVLQGSVVHAPPVQKGGPKATVPPQLSTGKPVTDGKSGFARMNQELFKMNPGNRPDSIATAKERLALAEKYKPLAEKLALKYGVPPALILAWMSRESGLGVFLRPDGYSKFDGMGYGLLQVDKRYHTPTGDPFGEASCDQAIGDVFKGMLDGVKAQHPNWTSEQQIAGALVDYNAGPSAAQTQPSSAGGWAAMDTGTTGNNYSQDVFAQAQYFADHMQW